MNKVQQRHGIVGARKCTSGLPAGTQSVHVTDGEDGEIRLSIGSCDNPAGMNPEQARYVAKCLSEAARRAEKVK